MTEISTNQANGKRLVIDLEICDSCETCHVRCGNYDRRQALDQGMPGLRERATFELICRQCEYASCVIACPFDAIERQDNRILKRHNLRCVSCKLCAHACPFGTIYTEMLPFYDSACDGCAGRDGPQKACVETCRLGALSYREVKDGEQDVYILDDHLAARTQRWVRQEVTP